MGFVDQRDPGVAAPSTTRYRGLHAGDRVRHPRARRTTAGGRRTCPYIDVPEPAIKKNIYYRWWLMRFNYLDADIPGQDFQFPTSVEGVLGYNNAIVLTQPMHIDDLKYLRDPIYSYGPWLSVGQVSRERPVPRQPRRPGELVQQLHPVHLRGGLAGLPDPRRTAGDRWQPRPVRRGATSRASSPSTTTTTTALIEYDWGALTGNDADAVSFHWRAGPARPGRVGATCTANALAAAQAYDALGNTAKATEMQTLADRIRNGDRQRAVEPEPAAVRAPARRHQRARAVEGDQQLLPVRGRR